MKVFYVFRFNVTKKKVGIYNFVINFLEKNRKKYQDIMVDIHFFEFEKKSLRGSKKKLMNNIDLKKYLSLSEFDKNRIREIKFKNIVNLKEENIYYIINETESDVFYKIIFNKIEWFDSLELDSNQKIFGNIAIDKSYNGIFLEVCFQINNSQNDYNIYVKRISEDLGVEYCERNTMVYLEEQEKTIYRKADSELLKLFSGIQAELDVEFKIDKKEFVKKVVFSNILKRMLSDTEHTYAGLEGGAYITYKRDINNNCLQILWGYDWNIKQVYATIRYRIPYSQYGYTLMLPVLKEGIHKENIELYISYVLNIADEIIDKYSDKIAYKFPRTPDWFSYY